METQRALDIFPTPEIVLYEGDCLEVMKRLEDNSVDAIVTDPPYGIAFMDKKWDYKIPPVEVWQECLRILKPGGHALVACGTRTQHRMAVNIEDAGFEIRDLIAWVYGSGFPKSLNIGKAVDKKLGNEREIIGKGSCGYQVSISKKRFDEGYRPNLTKCTTETIITKGNSEYEGWGTALKPAMELWTLCRKPLSEKTVAENVLRWGTGGINIDESRVGVEKRLNKGQPIYHGNTGTFSGQGEIPTRIDKEAMGRFPANFIHDGSEEVVRLFPNNASRFFYCAKASKNERNKGCDGLPLGELPASARSKPAEGRQNALGESTANHHPTVKPLKLMQYLCRLITPQNGTILDNYMGSGTTGMACKKEGFNFIGIEKDPEYFKIAQARIEGT